MRKQAIYTVVIGILLGFSMIAIRHIDHLNDGIEIKKIELKDNSAKLKLLNSKYDHLNTELNKKDADKAKLEKQLQDLQKEREKLQADLQAKLDAKQRDIAAKAQSAATAAVAGQKVYAASGVSAKDFIYSHESGNSPCKINGGAIDCAYQGERACGIGQALPCSKLRAVCSLADYACQDQFFTSYMQSRYGSWENAQAFWLANRWW